MKFILVATVAIAMFSIGCADLTEKGSQAVPATRYVPVGNDPEIALDTQTGELCRTFDRTNEPHKPLNETIDEIFDKAFCEVTLQQKKAGFVPQGCKSGKTWVRSEKSKSATPWSSVPLCKKPVKNAGEKSQ